MRLDKRLLPASGHCPATFPQFVWMWNRLQGQSTPQLHLQMARWLSERWHRGDRELLLMVFRNSGKSTLVGLFCAWLLAADPNYRILVLAGDFALARKMVRNVKRVVERHPLTRRLKPTRSDEWASDQFTVRRSRESRDPSMLAKGIAANITGLRADIVICDDVEVPNTCDTPVKRANLRARLREIEYVLVPGGLQLFVGTPHAHASIYADDACLEAGAPRPPLAGFRRLILPLLDDRGRSRWPERFTTEKIAAIRERSGPAKFESQMLLRPRSLAEGRLKVERMRRYDAELEYRVGNAEASLTLAGRQLVSASCWWDPSFGSPEKGDASVIAAVFADAEGNYWLHSVRYITFDPRMIGEVDEATQLCRQVASFVREHYLPAVMIETNGIGRFLPSLLRRELSRGNVACAVIEQTTTRSKGERILDAFDAVLAAERLWAHGGVWNTPFVEEMRDWRPGAGGRDDGLDAVAGCLLNQPVRLPKIDDSIPAPTESWATWRATGRSYRIGYDFEV